MYKCKECGVIFDTPKEMSAESYYGVGDMFSYGYEKISVCPNCEGTYETYIEEDDYEEENED